MHMLNFAMGKHPVLQLRQGEPGHSFNTYRDKQDDGALCFERFHELFSIEMIDPKSASSSSQRIEMEELRYQIYVREKGFEDPADHPGGRERDQYDKATDFVDWALIRHKKTGIVLGTARLILFNPEDMENCLSIHKATKGNDPIVNNKAQAYYPFAGTAEISIICWSKERLNKISKITGVPRAKIQPYVFPGLMLAALKLSHKHGLTHWIGVMEPAFIKLGQKIYGAPPVHKGEKVDYHGIRQPVVYNLYKMIEGFSERGPIL